VYNLEVRDAHTFFVGGENWGFAVWVHNLTPEQCARLGQLYVQKGGTGFSEASARELAQLEALVAKEAAFVKATIPKSGKLNAPIASDSTLVDAYKNLWRPQDVNPGVTIGELLREVESGGPLTHLAKAKGRLQQLLNRVNDTSNPLSAADRAGAERVISDLKDAIRIAEARATHG